MTDFFTLTCCQFSPDMGLPIFGQDGPLAEMAHGQLLRSLLPPHPDDRSQSALEVKEWFEILAD